MANVFALVVFVASNSVFVLCLFKEPTNAGKAAKNFMRYSTGEKNAPDGLKGSIYHDGLLPKPLVKTKAKEEIQTTSDLHFGGLRTELGNIESRIGLSKSRGTSRTRVKRVVFGGDNRHVIRSHLAEKCPFTTAVIISTGCSGVLVSPKHVLTSAHCLHNGSAFVDGYSKLRVGLLKNGSIEWRSVSSTKIPEQWKNGSDTEATKFDYALIKLRKRHNRCFLPLAPSKAFRFGGVCAHRAIHFTAFDTDRKEGTMLYRSCRVETFTTDMLFHCCDATWGSSGAGVYEMYKNRVTNTYERRVVGVFSGNRDLHLKYPTQLCSSRGPFYNFFWRSYVANYNAVLRFNEDKVLQICGWMRRLGGATCRKVFKERRRLRKRREKHRRSAESDECENVL